MGPSKDLKVKVKTNLRGQQEGWFWHIHHGDLVEWSDDIQERLRYILEYKAPGEIPTRLRWLSPVKGKLPPAVLCSWERVHKAWEESGQLSRLLTDKEWLKSHSLAVIDRTRTRQDKAYRRMIQNDGKYRQVLQKHRRQLETLHKQEHPGCPWDGETLLS